MLEMDSIRDQRIPLQENTLLEVSNRQQGRISYTILEEIGRGSSCIVYLGFYLNNAGSRRMVRIKECYPLGLEIRRTEDGSLVCESEEAFFRKKEQFCNGFQVNNLFSSDRRLTNVATNTLDIYEKNQTCYIVASYVEGQELQYDPDRSLRSVLTIARSIAAGIGSIHEQGFLYLDLKPSNIFLYRETEELIQLFDFDSPLSLKELEEGRIDRLSHSKGFAPLELLQGHIHRLGPWTDVYTLGALVYYLIFGKTPAAKDSDEDASYEFEKSIFDPGEYPDRMEFSLTEFLRKTLAGYYRDRYQNMDEVLTALDEMLLLANEDQVFLHSSSIMEPVRIIGRDRELEEVETWWNRANSSCLYVTGMGGIGKSTLIRKAIVNMSEPPENVIYLSLQGRIQSIVTDDHSLVVHGITRLKEEAEEDYFQRKLAVLKEISRGKQNLLVLDDFSGEVDSDVQQLLDLGWRTIIISRETRYKDFFLHLPVGSIEGEGDQKTLFEICLGRAIAKSEESLFEIIRNAVEGHTLLLELLGRQIQYSYLNMQEAADLVKEEGFSRISPKKIDFAKDQSFQYDSIRGIIRTLFIKNSMSQAKRQLLKEITLFYLSGREVSGFSANERKAGLELEQEGWIRNQAGIITMHPLIYEVVDGWEWNPAECRRAEQIMGMQLSELEKESQSFSDLLASLFKTEQILYTVSRERKLKNTASCWKLTGEAIIKMPVDREKFILSFGSEMLKKQKLCEKAFSLKQCMNICDKVSYAYLNQESWTESEAVLVQAKRFACRDLYGRARYQELKAQYYDFRLQGEYDPSYENPMLQKMLEAQEKAIHFYRKSEHPDSGKNALKNTAELVIVLSRSFPEQKMRIQRLLRDMKTSLPETTDQEAEYAFHMALAWYYTYVDQNPEKVDTCVKKAQKIIGQVYPTDLDQIDFLYLPYANMKLECRISDDAQIDRAIQLLNAAIEICDCHPDMAIYQRKKKELQDCLEETVEIKREEA